MVVQLVLLLATIAAAVLNGMPTSPLFDPVLFLLRPALAPIQPSGEVMFHMTTVVIALMTLSTGGIPAAIYEAVRRRQASSPGSIALWLLGTLLAATPGILGAIGFYDFD